MKNLKQTVCLLVLMGLPTFVPAAGPVVDEGLFLDGAEGIIIKVDHVDVWRFVPETEVTLSEEVTWPAQIPVNLLPCSVLEQIIGLAGDDNKINVRLWGLFTQYNGNNYLFSVYFLPVKEDTNPEPAKSEPREEADSENATTEKHQEEDSIIPTDVLKQIKSNKTPDLKKFQQVAVVTGDLNLIGRAGYLKQDKKIKYFQPSAFGQNVSQNHYILLPCEMLEVAENKMQKSPGRQRYNISGLVTHYKGRNYMLLRRAVRTYTNGNFTQ